MIETCRSNRVALIALASLVAGLVVDGVSDAGAQSLHDKAWWRAVIADDYTPPAATTLPSLARELSGELASTDPELRGTCAAGRLQWRAPTAHEMCKACAVGARHCGRHTRLLRQGNERDSVEPIILRPATPFHFS